MKRIKEAVLDVASVVVVLYVIASLMFNSIRLATDPSREEIDLD